LTKDTPSNANPKDKKKRFVRNEHGYIATVKSVDDVINYITTDSNSIEDELVEYVNLTRNEIYIIPHSY
jgi:hypothetical protein